MISTDEPSGDREFAELNPAKKTRSPAHVTFAMPPTSLAQKRNPILKMVPGQRRDVKSSPQSEDSSDFLQALEPAESAESGLGQAPQACPTQPYIFVDDKKDYKDEPLFAFCDSCKNHVMTNVSYKIGKLTVVSVGALCLLGCAAGCCLVPFLWKRFRDVVHSCPNCQIKLGKYQRTLQNFC